MAETFRELDCPEIEFDFAAFIQRERDTNYGWKRMMCEFIDNSFGACATEVRFVRKGDVVEIVDDGNGCPDPMVMFGIGKSERLKGNRASWYGFGGKVSQINATLAGEVSIETVTVKRMVRTRLFWWRALETGEKPRPEFRHEYDRPLGMPTGTKITLRPARPWKSIDKLARQIGFEFTPSIRSGERSVVIRDGKREVRAEAFKPPVFEKKVPIDVTVDGHRIKGYCGLVKAGQINPYPGFVFHWAYRVLKRCDGPALGYDTSQIYAEIVLPDEWKNHTFTKDDFADDPEALFEAIHEQCLELLNEAESASQDIQLKGVTELVQSLIEGALFDVEDPPAPPEPPSNPPGDPDPEGEPTPTEPGSPKERVRVAVPGKKRARGEGKRGARFPKKFTLRWVDSFPPNKVFECDPSSRHGLLLKLNKRNEAIYSLRKDAGHLAMVCLTYIAHDAVNRDTAYQMWFPEITSMEFQEKLSHLYGLLIKKPLEVEDAA